LYPIDIGVTPVFTPRGILRTVVRKNKKSKSNLRATILLYVFMLYYVMLYCVVTSIIFTIIFYYYYFTII